MLRSGSLVIVVLCAAMSFAQTTAPARFESLADGEVRYAPPPEERWVVVPLSGGDGRMAAYKHVEEYAVLTIGTNEQRTPIPNNAETRFQLGSQMVKAIRTDIEKSGAEMLEPPRLQRGEHFVITIQDKIRQDGVTASRLHLYRAMGYQLVRVSVRVIDQEDAVVQRVFEEAQDLLAGTTIGKRDRKPGPATRPVRR